MKDPKTLAYINMYGILGCLPDLCRFSPEAQKLAGGGEAKETAKSGFIKPTAISFVVKNGPSMTLRFDNGACTAEAGSTSCDIRLPFSSCEKFNGMIDGTVTPFPSKGFTRLRFLTQNFTGLTELLPKYLRATPEDLNKKDFFEASTIMMFHLITRCLSQVGNNDKIGRFSASNITDGALLLSIGNAARAAIIIKDHYMITTSDIPERCNAYMDFASLELARDVFDGKANTLACVGNGLITMKGNLAMVDNINRILDRTAYYLS